MGSIVSAHDNYLDDLVNTLVTSLVTLSRTNKRPSFGSVFLLNNIAYLRGKLLVNASPEITALLSKPTQDLLNSAFRTAKAGYFDSNFTPLMQTLLEDKDKSKSISAPIASDDLETNHHPSIRYAH